MVGKPYTRPVLVVYKLSKGLINQQSRHPARIMQQRTPFARNTAFSYLKSLTWRTTSSILYTKKVGVGSCLCAILRPPANKNPEAGPPTLGGSHDAHACFT